jgi:Uma2 family endonuclease
MAYQPKHVVTPQEYLALERQAECKSEYVAGEMFAMAGASRQHNLIVANIIRVLGNQLLEHDCNVYPSDMRVKISRIETYTYPDVAVACGTEEFEDGDTLLNPVVIIEVLSESTEACDRGKKFAHYQYLESLSEYILVAQEPYRVEQYVRQNDQTWTYRVFHSVDDVVPLETIRCHVALREVYAKIAGSRSAPA